MAVPWLYFGCTMAVHCGNTYLGPHEVDVRRQHGERVCRLVYHAVEAAQRGRHLHGVQRSAIGRQGGSVGLQPRSRRVAGRRGRRHLTG